MHGFRASFHLVNEINVLQHIILPEAVNMRPSHFCPSFRSQTFKIRLSLVTSVLGGCASFVNMTVCVDIQSQTHFSHCIHEFIENLCHFRERNMTEEKRTMLPTTWNNIFSTPCTPPTIRNFCFKAPPVTWVPKVGPEINGKIHCFFQSSLLTGRHFLYTTSITNAQWPMIAQGIKHPHQIV